ncbi:MAG: cytochrome c2 [Flavobacteriales bacterium]|jgi:cytochrome c2
MIRLVFQFIVSPLSVLVLALLTQVSLAADSTVNASYNAGRDELIRAYQAHGNELSKAYIEWGAAATAPAKPSVHGNRYLMTYVNDLGFSEYIKYANSDVAMPKGSIIAKESFKLKKNGSLKAGPLFFMEKVDTEDSSEFGGWLYSAVKPNGKPMKVKQTFCHSCHVAYQGQDFLGYPAVDVRLAVKQVSVEPSVSQHQAGVEPCVSVNHDNVDSSVGTNQADIESTVDVTQVNIKPNSTVNQVSIEPIASVDVKAFNVCSGCHQVGDEAQNVFGPVLNNIVGRKAATYPGYVYSASLSAASELGLIWTEDNIKAWLSGPTAFLQHHLGDKNAQSKMPFSLENKKQQQKVVDFLKSYSQ